MKPRNPKEVREVLGMVGYYRSFISRFADAARPMTKGIQFISTDECQVGFEYPRTCLARDPILKYLDPTKRYIIFKGASDQAAAAVFTQEYLDDSGEVEDIPIAYLSTQFSSL